MLDRKSDLSVQKYDEMMKIIHFYSLKLAKHVNNMIDITEIENNTFVLNKESFDLVKLVKEIINHFNKNSFVITEKNLNLVTNFNKVQVYADKIRIRSIIENLIINAMEISETKNVNIIIDIAKISNRFGKRDSKETNVVVGIKDDGSGLDKQIYPNLFNKYVSNSRDGLGLGLYMAKQVMSRHGRQIWAKNNNTSQGSTFYLSLPMS